MVHVSLPTDVSIEALWPWRFCWVCTSSQRLPVFPQEWGETHWLHFQGAQYTPTKWGASYTWRWGTYDLRVEWIYIMLVAPIMECLLLLVLMTHMYMYTGSQSRTEESVAFFWRNAERSRAVCHHTDTHESTGPSAKHWGLFQNWNVPSWGTS